MAATEFIDELIPFLPENQRVTSISSEIQVFYIILFIISFKRTIKNYEDITENKILYKFIL